MKLSASFCSKLQACPQTPQASSSVNGVPSKHSSPRPIAAIAPVMRPLRPSAMSASATSRPLGVAVGDAALNDAGDGELVALGAKRAGGDIGRGGRAADAGVAMDHHRLGAVPRVDEAEEELEVPGLGQNLAGRGRDDVGYGKIEMPLRRDRRRGARRPCRGSAA